MALCKSMAVIKYNTMPDAMTTCLRTESNMQEDEKAAETGGYKAFIWSIWILSSGRCYNWHLHTGNSSLQVNEDNLITCYHCCFTGRSVNGTADTVWPSNEVLMELSHLLPCLACKPTTRSQEKSLWIWVSLPIPSKLVALGLLRPQEVRSQ